MYGFPLLQSKSSSMAEYFFFFFLDLRLLVLFRGDRLILVAAYEIMSKTVLNQTFGKFVLFLQVFTLAFIELPLYSVPRGMLSPPFI